MRSFLFILILFPSLLAWGKFEAHYGKDKKSIEIKADKGHSKTSLKLVKGFFIDGEPQVYSSENFHLVFSDLTDHVVSTTLVHAYDDEARKIWSIDLKSFNPSTPLIEDEYVFLAATGKIFKVKKSDGKVAWKHEGLYQKSQYSFNGSGEISRRGPYVTFAQNVVVDDRNGKLLEVKK